VGGRYKKRRVCLRDLTSGERLSSRYVYIALGGVIRFPRTVAKQKSEYYKRGNVARQPRRYDGPAHPLKTSLGHSRPPDKASGEQLPPLSGRLCDPETRSRRLLIPQDLTSSF